MNEDIKELALTAAAFDAVIRILQPEQKRIMNLIVKKMGYPEEMGEHILAEIKAQMNEERNAN